MKKQYTPTLKFSRVFLAFTLILLNLKGMAQIFPLINGSYNSCTGKLTDSGGPSTGYKPNELITTTLFPATGSNTRVALNFSQSDIKTGDDLCIFDGPNVSSPLIACSSDYNNFPFKVEASPNNPTGCLTLRFKSNGSFQGQGFSADISCLPYCQTINSTANITGSNGQTVKNGYLELCEGETLKLSATNVYLQNNLYYTQSDATTKFSWIVNNKFYVGQNIQIPELPDGGYAVSLMTEDIIGCINNQSTATKVKINSEPEFIVSLIPQNICPGTEIKLTAVLGANTTKNVQTLPKTAFFPASDILTDTIPLPDGNGEKIKSFIYVNRFNPNEIIDEIEDLQSICLNIEHSFLKDLDISLICPNGQKLTLQDQNPSAGSVFLGIPFENDELLPEPIPGTGWDYCWTSTSTNGTWTDYIIKNGPSTLPSDDYNPFQAFDQLLGCPLNGVWTLVISDLWKNDNGFLFDWSVNFNPTLYPPVESFTSNFSVGKWLPNTQIGSTNIWNIDMLPAISGNTTPVWEVQSTAGCKYQQAVSFNTLSALDPNCNKCNDKLLNGIPDQQKCTGEIVDLKSNPKIDTIFTTVFTGSYSAQNRFDKFIELTIPVGTILPKQIDATGTNLEKICITAEGTDLKAIDLSLLSPDGKKLDLISVGNIIGSKLFKSCFTRNATIDIASSTAPYTGNFKSKNNWSNIGNSQIHGNWRFSLNKSDTSALIINTAELYFKTSNKLTTNWQSSTGTFCNGCNNFQFALNNSATIFNTTSDQYGCVSKDTANILAIFAFPAPLITCASKGNGIVEFSWAAIPGAIAYEVKVSGGTWINANKNLGHWIDELMEGEDVTIEVRVSEVGSVCSNLTGTSSCKYTECKMFSSVNAIVPASCSNKANGQIQLKSELGMGPYSYSLNGNIPQFNGTFINLLPGFYTVIANDLKGCKDTIGFEITSPEPIEIKLSVDSVNCFGTKTGKVLAAVDGGNSGYTYKWTAGLGGNTPLIMNVAAGNYTLTVTDSKTCSEKMNFTVSQPAALNLSAIISDNKCAEANSGSIDLKIMGGNLPYKFFWSNGTFNEDPNSLLSGSYTVTVTDYKLCSSSKAFQVNAPSPISNVPTIVESKCYGDQIGSVNLKTSGGKAPYTYQWNVPGKTSSSINNLDGGNFSVTTTDANGCIIINTYDLYLPEKIEFDLSYTDESCPGLNNGSIVLSQTGGGTNFNFNWSNVNIGNTSDAKNLAPSKYSVTITDPKSCSIVLNSEILAASPLVATTASTPSSCPLSTNGSATVLVTTGAAPFSYLWSDPLKQNTDLAINLTSGNYNVTITDSRPCQVVIPLAVNSTTILSFNPPIITPIKCSGDQTGAINSNVLGANLPVNYNWSIAGSANMPSISGLGFGKYMLTVTDLVGCTIIDSFLLTEPQPISLQFNQTPAVCKFENSGSLEITPFGGVSPYTYLWNYNNQTTPQLNQLSAGNYIITVTDINGCSEEFSSLVSEPSIEFLIATQAVNPSCFGLSSGSISVGSSSNPTSTESFIWNTGFSGTNINALSAGNYIVTATDGNGCTKVLPILLPEFQEIQINSVSTNPNCFGSTDGSFQIVTISGGASTNGITDFDITWNSQFITNPLISGLVGGVSFTLEVQDKAGCSKLETISLTQPDDISINYNTSQPKCSYTTDGKLELTLVSGGTAPFNYGLQGQSVGTTVSQLASGLYQLTVTDSKSCAKLLSFEIPNTPEIITNANITNNKCEADQNAFIEVNPTGGLSPYFYTWSIGNSNNKITNLINGFYEISCTDSKGCVKVENFEIIATNKIDFNLLASPTKCFDDENGSIEVDVTQAQYPLNFKLENMNWQTDNLFESLEAGNYQVSLKDKDGCIETRNISILSGDPFSVNQIQDITVNYGDEIAIDPIINDGNLQTTVWNIQQINPIGSSNTASLNILPLQSGYVWVKFISETGCEQNQKFFVRQNIHKDLFVPTAFSPNGDLNNDKLVAFSDESINIKDFKVFDKWGEMVYHNSNMSPNTDEGWDGTFRGKMMEPSVFVWLAEIIIANGTKITVSGDTTLLR